MTGSPDRREPSPTVREFEMLRSELQSVARNLGREIGRVREDHSLARHELQTALKEHEDAERGEHEAIRESVTALRLTVARILGALAFIALVVEPVLAIYLATKGAK